MGTKIKNLDHISAIDDMEVSALLADGAILLTALPGQASTWRRRLVSVDPAEVVATPAVESWSHWLTGLTRRQADLAVPLTALQEQLLWERVIDADTTTAGNSGAVRGLARHAAAAYHLLCEYRIDRRELASAGEEAEALARWISAMHDALKRDDRVLAADLPELLLPKIGHDIHDSTILLDGFDRFSPMQHALLQTLQERGVHLTRITANHDAAAITLTACTDAEVEYRLLARRIGAALRTDPHARIGVVLSRQVNDTERLRRILDETLLTPDESLTALQESMQAVTMSGPPLSDAPQIHQLLNLLRLAGRNGVPLSELEPLLFSPGVRGSADEHLARAALDALLREENRHYLNFRSLLTMKEMADMPQLAGVLRSLIDWETTSRPASEWVRAAHSLLQAIGFLQIDDVERSNQEIRQLNAFRECLASLVAADAIRHRMEWRAFLSLLVSRCHETPLSGPVCYPQVSVVPLEQAAGLKFDTVFAIGFDEEALPSPARPVPLLPFALQRRHGLPGSTAAIAFTESAFLWQQLQQAAPHLHVSYARSREEHELNPSPFLAGIKAGEAGEDAQIPEQRETEPFEDATSVPLLQSERIQGGAAILRHQSLCPFRAFATHRLSLAPLGETVPGVTPADKGSLLHRALEFIWQQLRSQADLLAMDEEALDTLIEKAIAHAWQQARITMAESTRQFERERMRTVLNAWLELERDRPPFSVERCEKPYRLELPQSGPVHFPVSLKADRIDRDHAGHKILIDYKTGRKQSIGQWIGERMAEPQLPLYAVAEGLAGEDAVCFARVRNGDMGFEGLSGDDTGIRGIAPYRGRDEEAEDWIELLACWHRRIDALASEFARGQCEVMPQDARACDYCGLEAVCRIDEIGIDRDAGEDTA